MNPRYFIGITLPNELSQKISEVRKDHFIPHVVMDPLVPHITLLDPNILMELSPIYFLPKVRQAADGILPIKIKLTRLDKFSKHSIYIVVESTEIIELRKKLIQLLPKKIRAQHTVGKEFVPHVTLIQAKPNQTIPDTTISSIQSKVKSLLPVTITVSSLDQFRWIRPRTYKVKPI